MKKPVINLMRIVIGTFVLVLLNSCNLNEPQIQQEKQIKSDHIIFDEFGSWKVKHVFDEDSLNYLYSNAKTVIILSSGEEFPFQIYRRNDHYVSYLIPGWIDKVIITIDGKAYTDEQMGTHTFHGVANAELFKAMASTQTEIEIKFFSGDEVYSGTIDPGGLNAALRWIRVIK